MNAGRRAYNALVQVAKSLAGTEPLLRAVLLLAISGLLSGDSYSQSAGAKAGKPDSISFKAKHYSFVHPDRNMIINAKILDSLFEQLYQLRTERVGRITLLQIGDSHIQADFISDRIRENLQGAFGNAGRGLVVPLRVGGSNEPFNYKITSNVACSSKRCVFVDNPMPIGIGGFTIQSSSDSTYFDIKALDTPTQTYPFNKFTLFYLKDSSAFDFILQDTSGKTLCQLNSLAPSSYPNSIICHLPTPNKDVVLRAQKNQLTQNNATIFGINLENDSASGLIYSSIGVNGAEAYHYVRAKYFAEETPILHPQLIIISLGTNEAQHRPFDKDETYKRLDSMVTQLQSYNPGVPILLTTLPDSYYHRKYYSPAVAAMHEVTVTYAKEHNLACWDLYSVTGGYKSCYYWKLNHLMQKDGVHFTAGGYQLQGDLFYEAFVKAYNQYASHRHK